VIPILLLLLGLIAFPLLFNFWMSLHEVGVYGIKGFVGLANFAENLRSPRFWHAFKINIIWTVFTVGLQLVVGTVVALILNERFVGRGISRSLVLIPYLTPPPIVALMWRWMLHPSHGIIIHTLVSLKILPHSISLLGSFSFALPTMIFIAVWEYFPFVAITVLARLQTIPPELPEAAKVDGASPWQTFWHVTLPQLKSVYFILILLRGIWMFNKFDLPYLLTGGGPVQATETLPILAYLNSFIGMEFGLGLAVNTLIFMILGFSAIVYFKVYKVEEEL
jgi:multiple sugar transport system permease protein